MIRDQHDWTPEPTKVNVYGVPLHTCQTPGCPATGYRIGEAWPPIRTASYALADTCEQAKRAATDRALRELGIDPTEVEA